MLYPFIKILVRLALQIFCREIHISGQKALTQPGPLLITANHPNSFLDAIIIGSIFSHPVHFLARGDAFKKPWHAKFLHILNMIPVYRISEGKENLHLNENAFLKCKEILSQNGIVLIFIEGICVHKHELQPFKKGAARIALENKGNHALKILPLAIAYDSFTDFGKTVNINICKPIPVASLFPFNEEAKNTKHFNQCIFDQLQSNILIPTKQPSIKKQGKLLLLIPGLIGLIIHLPVYTLLKNFVHTKTRGTIFFDSVLFGLLLFSYPLFVLLISLVFLLCKISNIIVLIIFLLLPFTAWCAVKRRE